MAMATELALGIAALLVAFALVWFGRLYSHIPFMNIGVVHVTYLPSCSFSSPWD
jgi:hypothetical protein